MKYRKYKLTPYCHFCTVRVDPISPYECRSARVASHSDPTPLRLTRRKGKSPEMGEDPFVSPVPDEINLFGG